jgi:hypothetical protein
MLRIVVSVHKEWLVNRKLNRSFKFSPNKNEPEINEDKVAHSVHLTLCFGV